MSLALRTDVKKSGTGGGTVSLASPSDAQNGDLLVACVGSTSGSCDVSDAGWVTVQNTTLESAGIGVFTRIKSASDPSTWGFTSAANTNVVLVAAYSSDAAPLDVLQSALSSVTSASLPSIPTPSLGASTIAGDLVFSFSAMDQGGTGVVTASAPATLAGYQESDAGNGFSAIAYEVRATPSTSGHTHSWDGTPVNGAAVVTMEVGLAVAKPKWVSSSAQVNKATATTTTVAIPADGQVAGRRIDVHFTLKTSGGTVTAPAGEGWTVQTPSGGTGLTIVATKIWGLGGQTDNTTTGNFTVSNSPTSAGWGYTVTVSDNPAHATAPWTSVAASQEDVQGGTHAANSTMTGTAVTVSGTHRTILSFFGSSDNNNHGTPSTGTLRYGDVSYAQTLSTSDYAQSLAVSEDVSSDPGITMAQTANGPDTYDELRIVLVIPDTGSSLPLPTGTVTLTGVALTITPGTASPALPAGALTLSGPALSITPGVVSLALPTGDLTVAPGAVTIAPSASLPMPTGELTLTGQALAVTPGTASPALPAGLITLTGVDLTLTPGVVALALEAGLLELTGVDLGLTPGAPSLALPTGVLELTGIDFTITPGESMATLPTGTLNLAGVDLTITPGPLSLLLPIGVITLTGGMLTITSGGSGQNLALPTGILELAGIPLNITPGAVALDLPAGTLELAAGALTIAVSATLALPTGELTLTGQALAVTPGAATITLPTGALALDAGALTTITPGPVAIPLPIGELTIIGVELAIISAGNDQIIALPVGTIILTAGTLTIRQGRPHRPMTFDTITIGNPDGWPTQPYGR